MILGENNEKMSKSRGNVVNPDDIVKQYGADTLRIYEMFIGDFEKPAPWNTSGIKGSRRFIERYWSLQDILDDSRNDIDPNLVNSFHKTIKKVQDDIDNLKFNTAIAALMSLINEIYAVGFITSEYLKIFTLLLSPFAPHVTEEVWCNCKLGNGFASRSAWPAYDESKCRDSKISVVLQVNGKMRGKVLVSSGTVQEEVLKLAYQEEGFVRALEEKNIVKIVYVADRILNVVAK